MKSSRRVSSRLETMMLSEQSREVDDQISLYYATVEENRQQIRSKSRRKARSNRKRRRRNDSARANAAYQGTQHKKLTLGYSENQQGLALKPQSSGSLLGRGGQNQPSKWRGKVTFWNDLHTTYFQKLDQAKITGLFNSMRDQDEIEPQETLFPQIEKPQDQLGSNSFLSRNLNEFFSFYGFYQDVINELQDTCDYEDDQEVSVLRAACVIDQHLKFITKRQSETSLGLKSRHQTEEEEEVGLFGYRIEPSKENGQYSSDYFYNQTDIEHQIEWLEKELEIVEQQVNSNVASLTDKIRVTQKMEDRKNNHLNSGANEKRLSHYFAQAINYMGIMQIAESIERVKAVRQQGPCQQNSSTSDKKSLQNVPYVLRKAYQSLQGTQKSSPVPFNSKEFLLAFDPAIGLQDLWVDASLFYLLNKLRNDMARRQNFGRGLPVQLSYGYQAHPILQINFDVDEKTKKSSGQEDERNIYQELELDELQQLQVKYGHETSDLRFCHHCKQYKRKVIFAKCNFNSTRYKMIYPPSTQVNGVKIYNAEGHLSKNMDCLTLKKLVKDKKRRKTFEEQLQITCEKYYCSLCIKNFYDSSLEEVHMNPDWICPYCTGQCHCTRCRRQEQMTTAQAYLISFNLNDLIYSPAAACSIFQSEYQKSTNIIDTHLKTNFERVVRTCDLSQASQVRLSANHKLQNLTGQGRYQNHYFLESSQSTSSHINQIMTRNLNNKFKKQTQDQNNILSTSLATAAAAVATKQPPVIAEESLKAQDKHSAKLRKRLHHEFRNIIADERSFCRTSMSSATAHVHDILAYGLPAGTPQQQSPLKHHIMEDWEYMQQYGEAHKQDTSNAAQQSNSGVSSTNKIMIKTPHTARAKPTKKLLMKKQLLEVKDFRAPLNKRSPATMHKRNQQPVQAAANKSIVQKQKNNNKLSTRSNNNNTGRGSANSAQAGSCMQSQPEAPHNVLKLQSHHSTGSTSPSQISKQTTMSANRPHRSTTTISTKTKYQSQKRSPRMKLTLGGRCGQDDINQLKNITNQTQASNRQNWTTMNP